MSSSFYYKFIDYFRDLLTMLSILRVLNMLRALNICLDFGIFTQPA